MGSTYLSRAAVLWVMFEAPDVPPELVSTLIAVAAFADTDGRNAYPAASTIAAITRKSKSQAARDMARLQKLGLLLPGDPRKAAHIRADRRPKVYDLAMVRGDAHDTPRPAPRVASRCTSSKAPRVASGDRTGRIQLQNGSHLDATEEVLKTSGIGERDAEAPPRARLEEPPPMTVSLEQLRQLWPRRVLSFSGGGQLGSLSAAADLQAIAVLAGLDKELRDLEREHQDVSTDAHHHADGGGSTWSE